MAKFLVLFSFLFAASLGWAGAPQCATAFRDLETKASIDFATAKANLRQLLDQVPENHRHSIEHLLDAVEFFDYTHTAEPLLKNFLEGGRDTFDFSRIYDHDEDSGAPFKGFLNARQYLKDNRPPLTADLLLEIHKRIMEGGVANLSKEHQGTFRATGMYGMSTSDFKMTLEETKIIESNPYMHFISKSQSAALLKNSSWEKIRVWTSDLDLKISEKAPLLVEGMIVYPDIAFSRVETIDLIKKTHPELWQAITAFRQKSPSQNNPDLEVHFLQALTENLIAQFRQDSEKFATVEIGKNDKDYINLVADFQRDLVSIHPLMDGNGRTTRLLMNYLLTSKGLPPVRIVDPFLDIQLTKEAWRDSIQQGVFAEAELVKDLSSRIRQGLTLEYSPGLLYPGLPGKVWIDQKKAGSSSVQKNSEQLNMEARQFPAFLQSMLAVYPFLKIELKNDRLRTMSRIASLFVEWFRSKTIDYLHEKDGQRDVKLRFVEQDFMDLFGVVRADRPDLWNLKIDQWYERDLLIWRGLSNRTHEYTDQELLNSFILPSEHLASNQVARTASVHFDPKALAEKMKADFQRYNEDLLTGQLIRQATDHENEGAGYASSYGFSTSKREVVGKAFAMGAMVIAPYGKQDDPTLQTKLKSRINIATYRALKDVDLGRLRAFEDSFKDTYGRQAEVMGIGGTDPDAVMIVQRINGNGDVDHSFVRSPLKPDQILKISGHYLLEDGPVPADRILKTYFIRDGKVIEASQPPTATAQTPLPKPAFPPAKTPVVAPPAAPPKPPSPLDRLKNLFK